MHSHRPVPNPSCRASRPTCPSQPSLLLKGAGWHVATSRKPRMPRPAWCVPTQQFSDQSLRLPDAILRDHRILRNLRLVERGRFGHRHLVTLHQLRDVRGLSHTESLAVLVPLQLHSAELRPSCLVHPLRRAANPLLIDPLDDILHQGGRSHRQKIVHVDHQVAAGLRVLASFVLKLPHWSQASVPSHRFTWLPPLWRLDNPSLH